MMRPVRPEHLLPKRSVIPAKETLPESLRHSGEGRNPVRLNLRAPWMLGVGAGLKPAPTGLCKPHRARKSFAGTSHATVSLAGLALVLAVVVSACGEAVTPLASAPTPSAVERTFPPIELPADEAPHDNLSEWWYFTGRLITGDRRTLGFEFVIFQAVRGDGPPAYAAHFAITDAAAGEMRYDERTSLGPSKGPPDDLDLCVDGWRLAYDGRASP